MEGRFRAEAAEADAARKALAEFTHALNLKLADANLVAANAKPGELLSAVEKALQRPTNVSIQTSSFDSHQAEKYFGTGVRAYRDRDFAQAEQQLATRRQSQRSRCRGPLHARAGSRATGPAGRCPERFLRRRRAGRQFQPSPRDVDELLARLPVADRSIVGQYRP